MDDKPEGYGYYRSKQEFLQYENNVEPLKEIAFHQGDSKAEAVIWVEPEARKVCGHLFSLEVEQPDFETRAVAQSYDSDDEESDAAAAIELELTAHAQRLGYEKTY